MLNDDEIRVDSYKLADGRRTRRMTHLATGLYVDEGPDSEESVYVRLRKLKEKLAAKLSEES